MVDEAPDKDREWAERAKRLLKSQLAAKGVTYAQLAQKLGAIGIQDTEKNLNNKISRGGFTAAFFLQCMAAIGVSALRLDAAD